MDVLRKIVRHFLSQVVSSPSLFTLSKSVISRKNSLFYLFSRAKKNTNKQKEFYLKQTHCYQINVCLLLLFNINYLNFHFEISHSRFFPRNTPQRFTTKEPNSTEEHRWRSSFPRKKTCQSISSSSRSYTHQKEGTADQSPERIETRQDHGAIQSGNLSSDHASLHPHGGRTIPSSFVLSIENEGTEVEEDDDDDDHDDDSSFSHGCAVYKLRERTMGAHETWLTLLSRSAKRLDNVVYSFFFEPFPSSGRRSWTRPNICPKSISRGRDPSTCQKILTGSLYYSGIIVARFVSYVSGWRVCFVIRVLILYIYIRNYLFSSGSCNDISTR